MCEEVAPLSSIESIFWWKIPPDNTSDFLIKVDDAINDMCEKVGIERGEISYSSHLGQNYVIRYMDHLTSEYEIVPDGYLVAYKNLKIFNFLSRKNFKEMFPDINPDKEYI